MSRYNFDAILSAEPTDAQADAIFEAFDGDAPTLATHAGEPVAMCHVEAESLEDALRKAASSFRGVGLGVQHFEVEPEAVEA